ncbi:hypothetical protein ES703_16577 [subsurface metagenome]
MRTIPVLLPDDLHKQFRLKLYQEDKTSKEFFLTVVRQYVEGDLAGPKKEDEKPKNPDPDIKIDTLDPPSEPEDKDKKPKEKIDGEKKRKTGGDKQRAKGKNEGEGPPPIPGEKKGDESNEPGDPGPRRKRGLWPYVK